MVSPNPKMVAYETVGPRGITFRSRLESRWAVFFDLLGWDWVYEPYPLSGWLPDFVIQGERSVLVEIKPALNLSDMRCHTLDRAKIGRAAPELDTVVLGASPLMPDRASPCAGLMREIEPNSKEGAWGKAMWARCLICSKPILYHSDYSWGGRPCWCECSGNGHLGELSRESILSLWGKASNETRWKARR